VIKPLVNDYAQWLHLKLRKIMVNSLSVKSSSLPEKPIPIDFLNTHKRDCGL